jgi:rifampicin phosphotransferase
MLKENNMSSTSLASYPGLPLVAPLTNFGRGDLAIAGGKGANLGELLRAGFEVPAGFVITTVAYDLLLSDGGFQGNLHDRVASLKPGDADSLVLSSREICVMIEHTPIPPVVVQGCIDSYHNLGGGAVAVRSSATAEDLPGAAFAGQQETFLNIIGETTLLDAVRACWASLWSERAVLYRARQGVDQVSVKLAVVVQRMVPSDVAGVMFTANPVSGARDEIVIDASRGLGEAVVSGLVTPDHFVLTKGNWRIKDQQIGRQEVIIRPKDGGGTQKVVPAAGGAVTAALSSTVVRQLARLGQAIEQHYGAPQDIEWAWIEDSTKAGKFLILQARPMTALPQPLKNRVSGPMRMVLPMLAEMWPERPYPLDMTTFTGVLERSIGNFLVVMIGKSAPDLDKALLEQHGVVVRFEPPAVHPSPGMFITPWLTFWRTRHFDPAKWELDPLLAEVRQQGRELNERDPALLSWAQNVEMIHDALNLIPRAMRLRERYIPPAILGLGSLWLMLKLTGNGDHLGTLLGGVETKTTETNRALQSLAAQIRSDPLLREQFSHHQAGELQSSLSRSEAGQAFLTRFEAFLAEYGHRETALTISQGAWKDQPQVVLEILKVQAAAAEQPPIPDSYQAWKRVRDELLSHSILGKWPLRGSFLNALAKGRAFFQIREDTHFYATLAQPPVRRAALELGKRMVNTGVIDQAEDILHLGLEEIEGLGQAWPPPLEARDMIRALVDQRQARREALAGTPMVDPRLLAVEPPPGTNQDILLHGSPGSPGLASGPARIVKDTSEFGKLRPGDILVAPMTNPAWTPLFQIAAGVVVDAGGAASHAAIVAREYGVPAVMGTLNGTQQLTDDQWIQVDGSHGLVLKGEKPA